MNNYNYKISEYFLEQLEDYEQRFPNIKKDIYTELKNFDTKTAQFLGQKLYKIRINSSDLQTGKSGGFRLIVLLVSNKDVLVPITLYFKGDKENISKTELQRHLKQIYKEF